jgi:hypothetical protein
MLRLDNKMKTAHYNFMFYKYPRFRHSTYMWWLKRRIHSSFVCFKFNFLNKYGVHMRRIVLSGTCPSQNKCINMWEFPFHTIRNKSSYLPPKYSFPFPICWASPDFWATKIYSKGQQCRTSKIHSSATWCPCLESACFILTKCYSDPT